MASTKRTEAMDRARKAADQLKPVAEQMKPLAKDTGEAARRQLFRTRAWAAPQVERAGKVFEDTVAPKVSAMLSTAAERINPKTPKQGQWRKPVGIGAALTAAASAAAAVLRNRMKTGARSQPGEIGGPSGASATDAGTTTSTTTDPTVSETEHQAHIT